jgi:hypothetical protein
MTDILRLLKLSQFFRGCPKNENDSVVFPQNVGQVALDYKSSCPTAERVLNVACFSIASV